jgi:hypothetical protein
VIISFLPTSIPIEKVTGKPPYNAYDVVAVDDEKRRRNT